MTWRLLRDLIIGLPGESLTKTAMRDDLTDEELAEIAAEPRKGHGRWPSTDMRIASLEDAVRQQTSVMAWLASDPAKRPSQPPMPEPVPRPGIGFKKPRKLSDADRAYLAHLRANRGALPDGYQFIAAS